MLISSHASYRVRELSLRIGELDVSGSDAIYDHNDIIIMFSGRLVPVPRSEFSHIGLG